MIPIQELRKLLLTDDSNMTDEELIELREQMYGMGQLAFEVWLEDKKKS